MKKAKRIAIAAAGLFVFGVTSALAAPYQKAQSDGTYAAGNVRTAAEEEAAEPPQAVKAPDAATIPAAFRKSRREIFFIDMANSPFYLLIDTMSPAEPGMILSFSVDK